MNIFELKQERAKAVAAMREIMDRCGAEPMGGEDQEAFNRAEAEFDRLNAKIEAEQKQMERERIAGEVLPKEVQPKRDELGKAFSAHLRSGEAATLTAYNAIQQDVPSQAGYLVAPEKFVNDLIAEIDNAMPFRQFAKKYRLTGAQSLGFPKRIERMNSAAWGTEIGAPTPDQALAFGKREFKPNFATAEIVVSRTLIANAPDVDGIVRAEIAYDLGELLENAYMTGDGTNKPLGIFTADANGISTARDVSEGNTATAITFDGLMEAKYAIKAQYQANLRWLFHRDAVKMLARIKDANNQYIWQPSVVEGTPDRLLGKPVTMSEYAPNTFTAGKHVGMLGDFRNYWICDGMNVEVQVLRELYARTNQIDYIARLSTDGMPVLEECFSRVTLKAS